MAKHIDLIMTDLKGFITTKLDTLARKSPMMSFCKPLVVKLVDNNLYKVEGMLKQFADKDGCLDAESLLDEMIQNVAKSKPFTVDANGFGELVIGGGKIQMEIPYIDKTVVFHQSDLIELKACLMRAV